MRISQLTFTRFIAAVLIVVFHYGQNVFPFNHSAWSFIAKQANTGVSYFFILSGFVMIVAYYDCAGQSKISGPKYLQNRIARIYPAYLLALLLYTVQTLPDITHILPNIDKKGFLSNLLMIQGWVPGKALSYNAPGWSLCVELFFYLLFPALLNRIYRRTNLRNLILPVLLIWLATQAVLNLLLHSNFYQGPLSASHQLLYYNPVMHLNEFLVGNLAGLFFVTRLQNKQYNADLYLLILLIVLAIALKFPVDLSYQDGLLAIIFVPVILLLSCNKGIISTLFSNKVCVFLGEISFGVYIYQVPINILVSKGFKNFLPGFRDTSISFFIFLVILIFFSALSFLYFETPVRKKIQKIKLFQS